MIAIPVRGVGKASGRVVGSRQGGSWGTGGCEE